MIAGGANAASGGIGKGANVGTGAGATGAAAQVMLLFLGGLQCVHALTLSLFHALENIVFLLGLHSKATLDLLVILLSAEALCDLNGCIAV